MNKNSDKLWLTIGHIPETAGAYNSHCKVKLSGMPDIRSFLQAFLPIEKEGEAQRGEFAKLPWREQSEKLQSTLGVSQTPYFMVIDDNGSNCSISEFLEKVR
jgi:hypothetical protein